jgi:aspartate carbamoyltransferase catalytic subunit
MKNIHSIASEFGSPKLLLKIIKTQELELKKLYAKHIYSIDQFDPLMLRQLFRLAAKYESNSECQIKKILAGKNLISAFYEPSTRTRLSFESAWYRLGGNVMTITDQSTTSLQKGESMGDTAEMYNNYADCIVLRDGRKETIYEMMQCSRIPIINGGNGIDEHPTQALADLYTIFKWRPLLLDVQHPKELNIKVGIIGLPSKMRTIRSLLKLFVLFPEIIDEIVIINNNANVEVFDEGQLEQLINAGISVRGSSELNEELPGLDVIYINAIAWIDDGYVTYANTDLLSKNSNLKKDAIILHPLARGKELAVDLDNTCHNWYFAQAKGAVYLRMAMMTSICLLAD